MYAREHGKPCLTLYLAVRTLCRPLFCPNRPPGYTRVFVRAFPEPDFRLVFTRSFAQSYGGILWISYIANTTLSI